MKNKINISVHDVMLVLFFSLFPILPDYFRLFSRPIYVFISIIVFTYVIFSYLMRKGLKIKSDSISWVIVVYTLLVLIPISYTAGIMPGIINFFKLSAPICITMYFARDEIQWSKIVKTIIVASVPVVLLSFIELAGFNIFSILENYDLGSMGTSAYTRMGIFRLESSFGHSITYAIYLSVLSLLVQYEIFINKRKNKTLIKLKIYLIIIWMAVILTLSRAPIAIFCLLQFLTFMRLNTVKKIKLSLKIIVWFILGILALYLVGVNVGKLFTTIGAFIETMTVKGTANSSVLTEFGTNANPYEYRFALFSKVFAYIKQNHISIIMGNYTWENTFSVDNGYLSILIFDGLLGLVGRLILYIYALNKSFLHFVKSTKFADYMFVSFAIILGYLLNLTSVAEMGEIRIVLIVLGLLFSALRFEKINSIKRCRI